MWSATREGEICKMPPPVRKKPARSSGKGSIIDTVKQVWDSIVKFIDKYGFKKYSYI